MSTNNDTAPAVLGDRYLVGEAIGRGGTAVVHRAWDSVLNRDVAVKMLTGLTLDPTARARFEDEGHTLARLNHPGLTTLFDAGTEQDRPYLVMELVAGPTLAEHCRQRWLYPEDVMAIGAALAETLAYVHGCGIVHRDIKPSNVLLGIDQRVRLADFGIARLLESSVRHTGTGLTMGTMAYLAPEQVRGEALTGACDIYALGLVLLEALTGRPAFSGPAHQVALARLTQSPVIDSEVPPALGALLARMTAADPAARPCAEEVAIALRAGTLASAAPVASSVAGPGAVLVESDPDPVTGPPAPSATAPPVPVTAPLRSVAASRQTRLLSTVGLAAAAVTVALVLASPLGGTDPAGSESQPGSSAPVVTASPTATPNVRRTDTAAAGGSTSPVVRRTVTNAPPSGLDTRPVAAPGVDPAPGAKGPAAKQKAKGKAQAPGQLKKIGK
jgi:hypothetical protein